MDNQHGAATLQKLALIFTIPAGITGVLDGDGTLDGDGMAGMAMDGDGTPDGDGMALDGDLAGVILIGMVATIVLLTIMEAMLGIIEDIIALIITGIHIMEDLVIEHITEVQETLMHILPEVEELIIIQNTTLGHEDLQLTAEVGKDIAAEELMLPEEHDLQQTIITTDPDLQITHILVRDHLRLEEATRQDTPDQPLRQDPEVIQREVEDTLLRQIILQEVEALGIQEVVHLVAVDIHDQEAVADPEVAGVVVVAEVAEETKKLLKPYKQLLDNFSEYLTYF